MIGTDGTLPFDPQKIADDILEEVQNPHHVHHRWHPDAPRRKSQVNRETVEEAIEWLNSPSPSHRDKSRINLYLEKRTAHANSVKRKDDSYKEALEMTRHDPRNVSAEDQQAAYNRWVAENQKRFNVAIQTAHMDWITTANKTDVEYHLCIVGLDLNKAIKRVLESQEAHTLESPEPDA